MGAGGIINQRAAVLLTAVNEPCFFDSLPQHCKDRVNAIDGKAPDKRTEADVFELAGILQVAVHC